MLLMLIALTVSSFVLNKKIDATNSTISFLFESKKVKGTIGDIQSSSSIDLDNFENSSLEGSVAITTLKTGNFLRDGRCTNPRRHARSIFSTFAQGQNT